MAGQLDFSLVWTRPAPDQDDEVRPGARSQKSWPAKNKYSKLTEQTVRNVEKKEKTQRQIDKLTSK